MAVPSRKRRSKGRPGGRTACRCFIHSREWLWQSTIGMQRETLKAKVNVEYVMSPVAARKQSK